MDGVNLTINGSQPRDVGQETSVSVAMAALLQHLTLPGGSQISTSGAYRFAIVAYDPRDEFEMRPAASRLQAQMTSHGWTVIPISLQELFLSQLQTLGDRTVQRLV
ncbi:MAG: hypothetical protein NXI04_29895, partial [Planctomycetaceae bacterium]|nr:hypothetical protein [Planctomycetaceae bacterium]